MRDRNNLTQWMSFVCFSALLLGCHTCSGPLQAHSPTSHLNFLMRSNARVERGYVARMYEEGEGEERESRQDAWKVRNIVTLLRQPEPSNGIKTQTCRFPRRLA
jgi:hypothetical protein